jgi:uncharacterized repeat protein (TIGR01451 family)
VLDASNQCQPGSSDVGNIISSRISLTASSDDTTFFYDHWEDGYDADPLNPGPTTLVGLLNAGETHVFEDDVDTGDVNWGDTLYFDGRDRITVFGEPVSVIRAASPSLLDSPIGTRLAGAWEIDEVANWGTRYIVPAGEDWGAGTDFEFTGASITAARDGTQIFLNGALLGGPIDFGNDDTTRFINGVGDGTGLSSGDIITATGPIEVHQYSSICVSIISSIPWSGNGYTLEPVSQWNNDYWSPVPRRVADPLTCKNSAAMDGFVFNNTGAAFDIVIDDGTATTVQLPTGSHSLVDLNGGPLSDSRGVHVYAPNGEPFWGIIDFDAGNIAYEWGYSLIPVNELSAQVVLGWAPGNNLKTPMSQYPPNGNLAFVMPVVDTVIFADFDQDGTNDAMDCNGDGDTGDVVALAVGVCDEANSNLGVPVAAGVTLRVADPRDADLTGALIYSQNLTHKLAVAWGQDSCISDGPRPYIDMGYTVLPISVPSITKDDTLVIDVDQSGDTSPGDVLEYTIIVANNGQGVMSNVVVTDFLPFTYTNFIVGSIITTPSIPAPSEDYYNGLTWGYTPTPSGPFNEDANVQQFRLGWAQIDGGQRVTVAFRSRIRLDVPRDLTQISNVALVGSDETNPKQSEDPDNPGEPTTVTELGRPILWLNKLPSDPTVVAPGGLLTYTIVISNVGTSAALSSLVVDDLPPWLTYVPGTLDLTWPVAERVTTTVPVTYIISFNETYGDNLDNNARTVTTGQTGNDGTLDWIDAWTEFGDGLGDPFTGDIQIVSTLANSPPSALQLTDTDGLESEVRRCADLSGFVEPFLTFQVRGDAGNTGANDTYRVEITSATATETTQDNRSDTTYLQIDIDLSTFAGQSPVCVGFVAETGMDAGDAYFIDDIFIYENSPTREQVVNEDQVSQVINYLSVTNTDPVTYTRILPDPFTTAITHTMHITDAFPFPADERVTPRLTTTFQVRVGYPLTDGLSMINTASITATNLLTKPYPLVDDTPTLVQSDHVLTITKTSDANQAYVSQLLTYNLFWEVGGDEPAPGVVVTDNLPLPYVSFVSCAPLSQCQGETAPGSGVVVWDLGDRLPSMSGTIYDSGLLTLTVRVDQAPPTGIFTNTTIIDDETDTPPDEDDEPTPVLSAGYTLRKQRLTPGVILIGENVDFRIVITNTGALTITQLPLDDTYNPAYLQFVSATPPQNAASPGLITWNDLTDYLPATNFTLPPGDSVQILVQFVALASTQPLDPPVTINTAICDSPLTDIGPLPRLEDQAVVEVRQNVAIELLHFGAEPKAGGVQVTWATLLEVDTFGFWLYRGTDAEFGNAEPVAFVPAKGWGGFGATYQYLDAGLPSGQYYYWLVEVENGGQETSYGPVSAPSGWDEADLPYRIYLPILGNSK